MQAVADEHATANKSLPVAPVGSGELSTDHVVPFHRSINVFVVVPEDDTYRPTAVQEVADEHSTPERSLFGEPDGIGIF